MSQTKRVFESAFIPYYTHAPVKVRKQSKVCLHKGIKMTDKKPRCRCKFCGWNYQDTCCCPNPITPNPIQVHTQEFEHGKLAGKKELVVKLEKEIDPDSYVARIFWYPKGGLTTLSLKEWLKSQLKEEAKK